jgi:DNA-binding CsgD family transcriptional regulator
MEIRAGVEIQRSSATPATTRSGSATGPTQLRAAAGPAEQDARLRAAVADAHAAHDDRTALADAVALARRGRGSRRRPSHGWESLTPAELDVVRLAADGLSNPEIGARLFMSRSTVKTHLSHVYAKLGVANRTELAARHPNAA